MIKGLRWYVLALMAAGTVVNYLDRNTLGVLAPVLRTHLHLTTGTYSYVVATFQLCYGLAQPFAGLFTDRVGIRVGYALCALLWGTACALHAFAGGWLSLALFRGLLGIAESAAIPTGVKMATLWFPPRDRAIATGWFNSGSSIGAMVAPPLVIGASLYAGWRFAFVATGAIGIALAAAWFVLYRDPAAHPRLGSDERRLIAAGREGEGAPGAPSFRRILPRRAFWGLAIARFLTEPAWQTFGLWIPLYMVSVRGMDIRHFALFGWLPFLAADFGCGFSGYLARLLGSRFRLSLVDARLAGIGIGAVCMIAPATVALFADPLVAIGLFSVGAFAHQTLSSLMYALVTDRFEAADVATATGSAAMFGYIGATLFSLAIGRLAGTLGYGPLFASLAGFDLAAFLALLLMVRTPGALAFERAAARPGRP